MWHTGVRGGVGDRVQRSHEALAAFETGEGQSTLAMVLYRSPPCVCGRDVVEVTRALAAAARKGLPSSKRRRRKRLRC
jgi:hypothetical protein